VRKEKRLILTIEAGKKTSAERPIRAFESVAIGIREDARWFISASME
jgi:hypothetical protein